MTTNERELRDPVELCTTNGRLNPGAVGWSRIPVHDTTLHGGWGRNKRWDYWGVLAGDLVLSVTFADVDYLGIVGVWWADLATGAHGGADAVAPMARGVSLPACFATAPLRYEGGKLAVAIDDDDAGTRLRARWVEADGTPASLDVFVGLPSGHESLNVVIPWSDRRFQYTSKHQARPAAGVLAFGGRPVRFGGDDGEAWGVLDVGRGRWPYRTRWNWGGGAGPARSGEVVGIQVGGRWTVGTGATENGVIVDGLLHKIGRELRWEYRWDEPMAPWRVVDPGGQVELTLECRHDKHTRIEAGVAGMEVHQVFGRWSGTVRTDDGRVLELDGIQGFAEEARNRW